jgi:hypothetical protein
VKARCDYGITIFILTYSLVAVSGYRVDALLAMAQQRLSTISIGISISLAVCVLVCPVWAGQELHRATSRNMEKLAGAVEACVEAYFYVSASATEPETKAAAEGYKCVLNSKASEDAQANLARWEPRHGKFGFGHPYAQYRDVGAAMRRCAYCVEALIGCTRSSAENQQAPDGHTARRHLADPCSRVAVLCARVLREAAISVSTMKTSWRSLELAVTDMNAAVQELQADLRAFSSKLLMTPEAGSEAEPTGARLMGAAQLFTVTTLLVELSARVEGVVDAVDTLATLAAFESVDDEKPVDESTKVQTARDGSGLGARGRKSDDEGA